MKLLAATRAATALLLLGTAPVAASPPAAISDDTRILPAAEPIASDPVMTQAGATFVVHFTSSPPEVETFVKATLQALQESGVP